MLGALSGHEQQLQGLVTNFNTTIRAFAAESENLARSVKLLAPTLERATPALLPHRPVAALPAHLGPGLEPGIRELPATIAASGPWLPQVNALLSPGELGYIADELRRAGPGAGSAAAQGKGLFSQIALLSNCFSKSSCPTGDVVLDDSGPGFDFSTGVPNFKEFGYAAAQLAGGLQSFDGNGPYLPASRRGTAR